MGREHKDDGFYRLGQPDKTLFYQWVERFYPQFEAAYEARWILWILVSPK